VVFQKTSRTHRGKIATYLIAEYHHGRLQSAPIVKLSPMPAPYLSFKTILELILWNVPGYS